MSYIRPLTPEETLSALGEDVVKMLTNCGIVGKLNSPRHCPIANFLKLVYPCSRSLVYGDCVKTIIKNYWVVVETPTAVADFVDAFDTGKYPELISP